MAQDLLISKKLFAKFEKANGRLDIPYTESAHVFNCMYDVEKFLNKVDTVTVYLTTRCGKHKPIYISSVFAPYWGDTLDITFTTNERT